MASLQMDAVSSFVYLTDNVPGWLTQLNDLSKHAAQKNSEFVAEYTKLVNKVSPKRMKSPSLQSIHSDRSKSAQIPDIDPRTDLTLPIPPNPVDIDPLEAGNKYLYAQAQRKRKPTSSVRSGASGPQKFRSKNQVVIYYDAHVQSQLDALVKAIGLARNNLRKGRNAHNASSGFSLPTLARKELSLVPSLDSLKASPMSRNNPVISSSKYTLSHPSSQPSNPTDNLFTTADKILETVSDLCQTAAHQFLRDGDCKTELDSAATQLAHVLTEAQQSAEIFRQKAEQQKAEDLASKAGGDDSETAVDSASDISISRHTPPLSFDPLQFLTNKHGPTTISQTLEDMANRPVQQQRMMNSTPAITLTPTKGDISNLPTAGTEIEVDDNTDDDGSVGEIDMSQFRAVATAGRTRTTVGGERR